MLEVAEAVLNFETAALVVQTGWPDQSVARAHSAVQKVVDGILLSCCRMV